MPLCMSDSANSFRSILSVSQLPVINSFGHPLRLFVQAMFFINCLQTLEAGNGIEFQVPEKFLMANRALMHRRRIRLFETVASVHRAIVEGFDTLTRLASSSCQNNIRSSLSYPKSPS